MKYFHELQLKGKRVVKRVDINSPVTETGAITINPRLERHGKSIAMLSDEGAKVIVLAHQGRKGKKDFVSLREHALLLEILTRKKVEFLESMEPEKVKETIENMKEGDILLLENVRMWKGEEEEGEEGELVKTLGPLTDIFVLDALSVSHRAHSSVVGLTGHAVSVAGPVLRSEIKALENIGEGGLTLILGGGKAKDSLKIMEKWLESGKARKVLLGGAISVLFLHASGKNIGGSLGYLEENGLLEYAEKAKGLLEKYPDEIMLPEDLGLEIGGKRVESGSGEVKEGRIMDIGEKTMEQYAGEILSAKRILVNGPMGVYEKKGFGKGTRKVLEAISESEAFSLVGGGHTITAIKELGLPEDKFSYISLSGKALIQYLSGKDLPAILALKKNRVERNV
ncbi:phosphoglycerate kinase [Candidatus Micrarchaeota archaeon]|nr:phosphoglycerate kinase [Candidatus Micrarchaeota archaeon]MBD3418411.1 phosphoglycerate kinase [Candidatus Micrarchaeota archaeon]